MGKRTGETHRESLPPFLELIHLVLQLRHHDHSVAHQIAHKLRDELPGAHSRAGGGGPPARLGAPSVAAVGGGGVEDERDRGGQRCELVRVVAVRVVALHSVAVARCRRLCGAGRCHGVQRAAVVSLDRAQECRSGALGGSPWGNPLLCPLWKRKREKTWAAKHKHTGGFFREVADATHKRTPAGRLRTGGGCAGCDSLSRPLYSSACIWKRRSRTFLTDCRDTSAADSTWHRADRGRIHGRDSQG